jgi:hypothetical protein
MLHEAINWKFSEFSPSTVGLLLGFLPMAQFIRSLSHREGAQGSINLTVFVIERAQNMKQGSEIVLQAWKTLTFTVSNYDREPWNWPRRIAFEGRERERKSAQQCRNCPSDMAGASPSVRSPIVISPPITSDLFHFLQENRSAAHFNFSFLLLP